MKDKVILILSIILVLVGVLYLSYTTVKFFNRPSTGTNNKTTETKNATLNMVGSSNKEIIGESLNPGSDAKITIELENKNSTRVTENLEGRVYRVKELNFFPTIESEVPFDSKQINATVNANSKQSFDYTYKTTDCGNFYIALADKDFWSKGRGKSVYGFFSVKCVGANTTLLPSLNNIPTKSTLSNSSATQLPKSGPADLLVALGIASVLSGLAVRIKVR